MSALLRHSPECQKPQVDSQEPSRGICPPLHAQHGLTRSFTRTPNHGQLKASSTFVVSRLDTAQSVFKMVRSQPGAEPTCNYLTVPELATVRGGHAHGHETHTLLRVGYVPPVFVDTAQSVEHIRQSRRSPAKAYHLITHRPSKMSSIQV